jgi:hypothetical protein
MNENLQKFIDIVNNYAVEYYATQLPNHTKEFKDAECARRMIRVKPGKKFIKLVNSDSVFAFVEIETGNIFKPASFAAPAKGIRGNINSPTNGKESLNFVPGMSLVHINYAR